MNKFTQTKFIHLINYQGTSTNKPKNILKNIEKKK